MYNLIRVRKLPNVPRNGGGDTFCIYSLCMKCVQVYDIKETDQQVLFYLQLAAIMYNN